MDKFKKINHKDIEVFENCELAKYSTIKLSAIGSIAIVRSENALKYLIENLKKERQSFHIVGWGSNQVLTGRVDLYIKLEFDRDLTELKVKKEKYDLPASTPILSMISAAKKFNLSGWEVLTGIPASLGGAICMNAGTSLGEIAPLIHSVRVLNADGDVEKRILSVKDFSYRKNHFLKDNEIILSAEVRHLGIQENLKEKILDYLDKRNKTQPLKSKNCGSVFKNKKPFIAGQVIDVCGLKGFGDESLFTSFLHANFIEHTGNSRVKDFEKLIISLKKEIERHSGQKFELEVKIV